MCHDATADTLFDICEGAGLDVTRGPEGIFSRVLPAAALIADPVRGKPAIIPDAAMRVALPPALTSAASRPSTSRLPLRRLLFDAKTIHAGSSRYTTHARARDRQCGAVEERAQQVHPDYVRHARKLDRRYHGPGTLTHRYPVGPVEQVLLDHVWTRGLAFGAYGEWSWDAGSRLNRLLFMNSAPNSEGGKPE